MRSFRSTALPMILVCAPLVAAACGQRVNLGAVGDGGAALLWSATFEPGDLSEWVAGGGGGAYSENVMVGPSVSAEIVHQGRYAGKVTTTPMMGMISTNYLYRDAPSPAEAYYSAWFYVPSTFAVETWLSIIHFRGSPTADGRNVFPTWDVNLRIQPDGNFAAQIYDFVTQINHPQATPVLFRFDTWVHFEFLLRKAVGTGGRVALWQDDVLILDLPGVATGENAWAQWSIGASSGSITPLPGVLYVDDAAISLDRLGTAIR